MSDFKGEDYDFAAGSVQGMRSWGMDSLGRLHGITHKLVWRPGENVAACQKQRRIPCPKVAELAGRKERSRRVRGYEHDYYSWQVGGTTCGLRGCADGTHPAPSEHAFDANCECGFWAYDEHSFQSHGDVSGVIEGYGKTTIGTRGFRCEKARVIALCREWGDANKLLSLSAWLRLQQLYPDAKFYEDADEMVSAHGGVLREWAQVGEDFWEKAVPQSRDEAYYYTSMLSNLSAAFAPPTFRLGGVTP